LFLGNLGDEKFYYPIGLLLGLIWHRVAKARAVVTSPQPRSTKHGNLSRILAWLDLIIIVAVTVGISAYVLVEK